MDAVWRRLKKLINDDSMSIALFGLFLLSVTGQGFAGWSAYDASLKAARLRPIGLGAYLGTGNFLDGMLSNWQAAILQLAVLITFGSVLRQKGAVHSRQPKSHSRMAKVLSHRTVEWKLHSRSTARGAGVTAPHPEFARHLCCVVQLLVLGFSVLGGGVRRDRHLHRPQHILAAGPLLGVEGGRRKRPANGRGERVAELNLCSIIRRPQTRPRLVPHSVDGRVAALAQPDPLRLEMSGSRSRTPMHKA